MRGLLVDTFTRQTVAETTDDMGGFTNAWSDGTTFEGRLSAMPIGERMSADRVTVYATHRLYCESLTITEKDRVTLGSRTFEVKAVRNPSNIDHHLEIDLLEID